MTILLEGTDRVGKSSQAQAILNYFASRGKVVQMLHYGAIKSLTPSESESYSGKLYTDMFLMAKDASKTSRVLVFDRSHLGEYVYAPMYRNYDGSYIFDIEEKFKKDNPEAFDTVYLLTFIDDAESIIKRDDGLSFTTNLDKKQKEIDAFVEATNKSHLNHKKIINIKGKSIDDVSKEVIEFISSGV